LASVEAKLRVLKRSCRSAMTARGPTILLTGKATGEMDEQAAAR
jgi:hypothetical protein